MVVKAINTFLTILFIFCQAVHGWKDNGQNRHFNVHSKLFLTPSAASDFVYNEAKMKEKLAKSGINSSTWDEFNVYIAPQHGLKERDKIKSLPGQPRVNFNQYSGYVTVSGHAGRALFYYFVEATENPSTKPLVLWLNGGPGCSSLSGAMTELGPFRPMRDGKTLAVNPYAWNKVANIIFLESPAGVGFSYSNTTSDYNSVGDKITAQDSYTFLINWLERYPEYKNRDFYITGQSYAGHYAPQLAKLILQKNKKTTPARVINLQGLAVGNGAIDDTCVDKGMYDFLYNNAIITKYLRDTFLACTPSSEEPSSEEPSSMGLSQLVCENARKIVDARMETINTYAINFPSCDVKSNISMNTQFDPCTDEYAKSYLNMPLVQDALGAQVTNWEMCSDMRIKFNAEEEEPTIMLTIKELMEFGLKIWLYSGDKDSVVPIEATECAIKALGLSIKTNQYPWYNAPNEVGGYVTEYHNLTFITIRDSGHFVPSYQPARALTIFSSFLQGKLPPATKS